MPGWRNSDRRSRLPANWASIRREVLRRDGNRCTWREHGDRCATTTGLEVDHIRRGDDHSPANLRTLCSLHHASKSAQEGAEALAKRRAKIHSSYRRHEDHPSAW